jgi:hypothetical protein
LTDILNSPAAHNISATLVGAVGRDMLPASVTAALI